MKNLLLRMAVLAGLCTTSAAALAGVVPTIPEPGILGLLVAGGIVGALITLRKRRK